MAARSGMLRPESFGRIVLPLLLLGVGMLRLVNLGFIDMQAWDEGLYAVRAWGILRYGGWLDQSPFAIDGLYSALHPPLYIWSSAVSFLLFGVNEFAARLPSALCGAATTLLVYLIGRRLAGMRIGAVAALLLALNPFVDFYARQAQFDSMLLFFLVLAVHLALVARERPSLLYPALCGAAIGAALMTKLFVAGVMLPVYVAWIFALPAGERGRGVRNLLVMISAALAVALPWHAFMVLRHGGGDPLFLLQQSQMFDRVMHGIEGNEKSPFYFFNQMLVLFPCGVAWCAYGLVRLFRESDPGWKLLGIWFGVFFAVFSAMSTKLEFYLLPMLVPGALVGARELVRAWQGLLPRRTLALLAGATLAAVAWALRQEWRTGVKAFAADLLRLRPGLAESSLEILPLLGLLALAAVVTVLLLRRDPPAALNRALPALILVPAFLVSVYTMFVSDRTRYDNGGRALARFVEREGFRDLVAVGFERNPQISYYLGGVDIGWRDDIAFRRLKPPADTSEFREWFARQAATGGDSTLYVWENDKLMRHRVLEPGAFMPAGYDLVFSSYRYSAFLRNRGAGSAAGDSENDIQALEEN